MQETLDRLRQIVGKEDIILAIFLIGIGGVIVTMQQPQSSSYTPSQFCKQVAAGVESNYTNQVDSITCHCESPRGYRGGVSDKVGNVTDLEDVLVCDVQYGQQSKKLVYPLHRINKTEYQQYNQTGTLPNTTGTTTVR
ncbi:MAG: hypothetical protein SV186_03440 [Candidatus Nanohaloarchaea archaeon]|nr:hypothetical protein [Candidatus Nanohaloarchaea archaeon]